SAHRLTAARPHLSFAHLHGPGAPGVLPSFPTRRSSDLGPAAMVPVPRTAGTVILAVDVSNSMGADDVAPTRLAGAQRAARAFVEDRKSTRLNSSHVKISYAVFCLKKKRKTWEEMRRDRV